MFQEKLQRIEKIKSKMSVLEDEKNAITTQLKASILNLFDDKILERCDFNALIGGIINVQKTLMDNQPNHHETIEGWKKEGINVANKSIKIKKPKSEKIKK
jgi:hypothetical protein